MIYQARAACPMVPSWKPKPYQADRDQAQAEGEVQVAEPAPFAGHSSGGPFEGQQVEHHHRPAGPAAPDAAKQQRAEDLGDQVVDDCGLVDPAQQAEENAFELHIFLAVDGGKTHQEGSDQEQGQPAPQGFLLLGQRGVQPQANAHRNADIAEEEQRHDLPR